ncbi:type I glutamate--ammonia ligase [Xylella fastidiosa]|uniref:Glutamine synthetase n=1 Tax=Xylella fastidiosa subsp. multiplex TaxID=644357 RepID=A0A9Q4MGY4_XYLFS|nr:type I glutamate--ammonia ligase [Xylella fastidiosa]ACA12077.1 Glutamate--ammonia ligase [Xylella fastidiosa M12]KAJ4851868.1 type I glutamate--ammonia ligase [Xylella fastidiosa subsp. multiplex]KFA40528.1 glutamate--ammonia ligase [Xylella fastidiosa]MBE0269660.1 type I glutamate--ammonia ligase [Xylella fastidiosa subsp. multiplex]MBE0276082.1 type I glutamate--ammonia ligase [Xylella fastidiosa subsp. multiplex]
MSLENVEKLVKDKKIEFVDLRFVDMRGVQQHVTFPVNILEPSLFKDGKMFDGSSIAGWKGINESDMVLLPDASTAYLDPFYADPTLVMTCDILDPATMHSYVRDPRGIAKRAEIYLNSLGIADQAFFGPEPEFFIFDSVRFANDMGHSFFQIASEEAAWNTGAEFERCNSGYRPAVKGGYFPVPPTDSLHDLRAEMVKTLEQVGIETEVHHHEVATAGQCEIGTKFDSLVKKADQLMTMKYILKNVAYRNGKTVTFMPKPIVGDNGSGMHVHQSLSKGGVNLFSGDDHAGLSQLALYYIGGIFKHAHAINAFSNSGTNSYKRLVPGFEAPVMLAYSARNRSASCRIPWVSSPKARRIEMRFPDPLQSGYLTFTALMMAGLDGIKNKIHPGPPNDKDLYHLPPEEEKLIPQVCSSLDQALEALDKDRDFLKAGGVMSDDFINGYIALKMQEVTQFRAATHPLEYQMYYAN